MTALITVYAVYFALLAYGIHTAEEIDPNDENF